MSASPDDPDFLQKLMSGINNGLSSPLGLLAMSLMGASGPSRMPVSTGQALAQGYAGATGLMGQVQQNRAQQLELQQNLMRMHYMQQRLAAMNGGQAPSTSPVAGNPLATQPSPAQPQPGNPLTAPPQAPSNPLMPQTAPDFNGALNSNPLYQQGQMDSFMGMPGGSDEMKIAANAVQNQKRILSDAEVKQITGAPPLPGRVYSINPLGALSIEGSDPYQVMRGFNPYTGAYTTEIVDTRDKGAMQKAEAMQDIGSDPTQPLPPTLEKIVDQAIAGKLDPKSQALKSPIVIARIAAKDPTWSEQDYPTQMKARQAFAPGGTYNKNLVALSTAAQHIDLLTQYINAMQSGNTPALNAIQQAWQKQTGSALPTNFDAIKSTVAAEIAKANGEASLGALEDIQAPLKKSGSPAQLLGAIQGFKGLLAGKAASLRKQYVTAKLGSDSDFNSRFFTDEAQTMFGTPTEATGLPQGWSVVQH